MARDFEIGRGDDLDVVLPSHDASVVFWLVGELGVRRVSSHQKVIVRCLLARRSRRVEALY